MVLPPGTLGIIISVPLGCWYRIDLMEKPYALIVEDDRDIAALFRHVLDMAGFQTEVVLHGQTAAERLAHGQPDIVLLDLSLPGISGGQILGLIRKDARLSHTKVIVITGQAHIAGGLPIQPDLLLLKPVSVEQLSGLISRLTLSDKSPKAVPMRHKPLDRQTGLYNQSFFKIRLMNSLRQAREIEDYMFAVLLFKLERRKKEGFPSITSKWETTLWEVAGTLRKILRPTDTIARFDSDTFYILIENIPNGEIAVQAANRIQDFLYRNISDVKQKIETPIRIGILLCNKGYENVDFVLSDAKYALVLAGAQGEEYARFYYQVSAKNP